MKLGKRKKPNSHIPDDSQADIAFLLLIFFMVSTVFKTGGNLKVDLPEVDKLQKLPKRQVARIWINKEKTIVVDGKKAPLSYISMIMGKKRKTSPKLMVALNADKSIRYGFITEVMEQLKEADALRVSLDAVKRK